MPCCIRHQNTASPNLSQGKFSQGKLQCGHRLWWPRCLEVRRLAPRCSVRATPSTRSATRSAVRHADESDHICRPSASDLGLPLPPNLRGDIGSVSNDYSQDRASFRGELVRGLGPTCGGRARPPLQAAQGLIGALERYGAALELPQMFLGPAQSFWGSLVFCLLDWQLSRGAPGIHPRDLQDSPIPGGILRGCHTLKPLEASFPWVLAARWHTELNRAV